MSDSSKPPHYALVSYLRGPIGKFIEQLRAELDPEQAHLAAHVSVLPPRLLKGSETDALHSLASLAMHFKRFQVTFGDVDSFAPASPTVFIRASHSAGRFRDMHEAFNRGPLSTEEPWPYVPHLTIVKTEDFAAAAQALDIARQHWATFRGNRFARIEELTFVREAEANRWIDVHTIRLRSE